MRIVAACVFAIALLTPSSALSQTVTAARYQVPAERADGWTTANADSVGLDSTRLATLTTTMRAWPELGVHAILIERRGRLVYENTSMALMNDGASLSGASQ